MKPIKAEQTPLPGDAAPKLIQCRVKPNNRYGGKPAGDVVEVTEREYRRCGHALISLDDEKRAEAKAEKATADSPGRLMYHNLRDAARAATRANQEAARQRQRQQLEAMGLKVAG
jgi:hypothetical protein